MIEDPSYCVKFAVVTREGLVKSTYQCEALICFSRRGLVAEWLFLLFNTSESRQALESYRGGYQFKDVAING